MGVFDFDRAFDSTFNTAFDITVKLLGATVSGTFSAVRSMVSAIQAGRRIKASAQASRDNRGLFVSSSVDKRSIALNDDPRFDDTETVRDMESEPALGYIFGDSVFPESIIVSGGSDKERCKALLPFAVKSHDNGIPIVALHCSDSELESMLSSVFSECDIVSRDGMYCDIFAGLGADRITMLLYDTIDDNDNKPEKDTEPLIRSLVDVILAEGGAYIEDIASFPLDTLQDKIESLRDSGIISDKEHADMKKRYSAGSCARNTLSMFLSRLNLHFTSAFGAKREQRSNITRMINRKGAAVINIGGAENELAVRLIIKYLRLLGMDGRRFCVITDNISLGKYPEISNILNERPHALSHKDFISSLSSSGTKHERESKSEELFSDFSRGAEIVSLFHHASMSSCRKWSEYLGTYHKIKTQKERSIAGGFFDYHPVDAIGEHEYDLPRVRDITISKLPAGITCVNRSEGIFIGKI